MDKYTRIEEIRTEMSRLMDELELLTEDDQSGYIVLLGIESQTDNGLEASTRVYGSPRTLATIVHGALEEADGFCGATVAALTYLSKTKTKK
jgi:hypothetical protein